ncbi:citrate/2-methylcitrate synthase [Xenorhabdus bovienii]|uniref:citrate/2-methylcitrate synthase n=1 Tax=Xenorhabdus bovienii TaxID=40576 RepID=UPI0023B265BA|nr:citrate/2-methylcitrate synthase [Xenorhabdus bovienii]MDE9536244.1 citrate/2-methylcitrate synthase [Xenorhabdus bovienii]MDE9589207.1 citrate/2-methylcitrate synthase [Xenorhabdus bovienii]
MTSQLFGKTINDFFEVKRLSDQTILKPNRNIKMKILDEGLMQTAICKSHVGKIDEKNLKLEYRGYNVKELANKYYFSDVVYLLITGELDTEGSKKILDMLQNNYLSALKYIVKLIPIIPGVSPTDFLKISLLSSKSIYNPNNYIGEKNKRLEVTTFILAAIAAAITVYNQKYDAPEQLFESISNIKHNFFASFLETCFRHKYDDVAEEMLNKFLVLHAEHGVNCSTATVRTVASSGADPFNSIAAGIGAFSGPLHGGASEKVGLIIDDIHENSRNISELIDEIIDKKLRLMGFGHRIYKQQDPRASYMQDILVREKEKFNTISSYINISQGLAFEVSKRSFFSQRGLYPNPDLFNGLLLRRVGFESHMNTALLCFSRAVGWLAHYYDSIDSKAPILRPQEVYL